MDLPNNDGDEQPWIYHLLGNPEYSDAILKTTCGREYPVHKVIVCSFSSVLWIMLSEQWLPNGMRPIEVEMDMKMMKLFLSFLYTGDVTVRWPESRRPAAKKEKLDKKLGNEPLETSDKDDTASDKFESELAMLLGQVDISTTSISFTPHTELDTMTHLYRLGDYYQITAMKRFPYKYIEEILNKIEEHPDFPLILESLYQEPIGSDANLTMLFEQSLAKKETGPFPSTQGFYVLKKHNPSAANILTTLLGHFYNNECAQTHRGHLEEDRKASQLTASARTNLRKVRRF